MIRPPSRYSSLPLRQRLQPDLILMCFPPFFGDFIFFEASHAPLRA